AGCRRSGGAGSVRRLSIGNGRRAYARRATNQRAEPSTVHPPNAADGGLARSLQRTTKTRISSWISTSRTHMRMSRLQRISCPTRLHVHTYGSQHRTGVVSMHSHPRRPSPCPHCALNPRPHARTQPHTLPYPHSPRPPTPSTLQPQSLHTPTSHPTPPSSPPLQPTSPTRSTRTPTSGSPSLSCIWWAPRSMSHWMRGWPAGRR
ncbi:hypothetical protein DXG03_005656, partial [Asterophora parasitica]